MRVILLLLLCFLVSISCQKEDDNKLFTLLSPKTTGINFVNRVQETEEFNVLSYGYLYNGGGVSIGDVNNDGLPDIYFTGNMVGSHLYINEGDLKFKEIAKEAGVFAEGLWNTGTTMADVNADGLLDIYVCRSAAKDPTKRKNLLFINNGPATNQAELGRTPFENVTFTEKAAEYGIDDSGYSTQAAFFDYDKDGDLDLYVLNHSSQEYAGFGQITASLKKRTNPAYADKLYRNDNGKFIEVGEKAGLVSNVLGFGLGLAISDINNDGWSDIYISNDYNEQDYLYINNQNGTFTESLAKYIGHTSLFSMGSDIADINNDGYTDIITLDMLPEGNERQKMISGPDNYDKYQLLVQSGFYNQTMRNMLQLNNQGQSFSEIGQYSGISNTDWSWSSLLADFDNDGFKDVFISNGYKRDYTNMDFMNYAVQEKLRENKTGKQTAITELLKNMPSTIEENYMYRNKGDLTFSKMNAEWGLNQKSLSNGAAYSDLDNDGDLDLVVNNIEEEAFIYRNNSEKFYDNHYLKVKLKGEDENTLGIGAQVTIFAGSEIMMQEVMPTRGYQSSVDPNLVFGLGDASKIDSIALLWPNFKKQTLKNIKVDQTLILQQKDAFDAKQIADTGQSTNSFASVKHTENPTSAYYKNTSDFVYFTNMLEENSILYIQKENKYNDFKREQLLPHQLSTQGPKMAKGDVNGDGLEDLFIGGAKGSAGKLLLQNAQDGFERIEMDAKGLAEYKSSGNAKVKSSAVLNNAGNFFLEIDTASEDIGSLFFDADGDGDQDLYVVSGGNEFDAGAPELQDRLYINNGKGELQKQNSALPSMFTSGSCVSASDFDSDGDLDLFIGGRLVPGQYPKTPRSYILQNDGKGNFSDITTSVGKDLEYAGMVTDAIWTDFDGDSEDDLILVGEFMPVRAFKNDNGRLIELEVGSGLENSQGWWNRITPGDFDNDGDTDYIVGNFGLNSQLKANPEEPVQLYYKDFDNNGSIDPIMTSYIEGESYPVFSKDDLLGQLSGLKGKYVNYSDYANQKITDIFASRELADAKVLEAKNFASSYIENLGNSHFKITPLPAPAQFSPIYSILAKDLNTDGNLDIVVAGNFFGNRVKYGRYDANKGLLLLGNGKGGFEEVAPRESGLNIDGEVRDIVSIKGKDGKEFLIFARNDQAVKEYLLNVKD